MLIVISYIKINNNIFNNGENVHWKKYYKKAKKKKKKKLLIHQTVTWEWVKSHYNALKKLIKSWLNSLAIKLIE